MANPDPTDKLLDELLAGKKPEEILGENGLLDELTKRLAERAFATSSLYIVSLLRDRDGSCDCVAFSAKNYS